jgi:hypothetical protein
MSGARALIHLTGAVTQGTMVPAEVLARTVDGFQKAIWLVAAAAQERELKSRFKPSSEFRRQFTLKVRITEKGGYAIPTELSDESMPLLGGVPHKIGVDVIDTLLGVWDSVGRNDHGQLESLLPNEEYRQKLLSELKNILPRREDGWKIGFGRTRSDEVVLDYKSRNSVEQWIESSGDDRAEAAVVIGRLLRIDFVKRAANILYRPTSRVIGCYYLPEAEDDILAGRKGLFQASGKFVLDSAGNPRAVLDVRRFEPVNLTPAAFDKLEADGQVFLFDPPMMVVPELDPDTEQWFVASIPELNIEASGKTRDALFEDIADQVRFVWKTYAMANDDALAEDALALKRRVLERVRKGDA